MPHATRRSPPATRHPPGATRPAPHAELVSARRHTPSPRPAGLARRARAWRLHISAHDL